MFDVSQKKIRFGGNMQNIKISLKSFYLVLILSFIFFYCEKVHNDRITGSGTLEATEITISSKIIGQVLDLLVKEGDQVQIGSVIATIDTEKYVLQREQIEAGLAEVNYHISTAREGINLAQEQVESITKKYDRIKKLQKEGAATQQQLDDVETIYNQSQTRLKTAESNLKAARMKKQQIKANLKLSESQIKDATIVSPASGIVINKFIEKGENVAMGLPIVIIADLTKLWIKLYVTAPQLGFIQLGEKAEIQVDSFPDRKFEGKIIWISSKAEFTPKNIQTEEARADLVYAVKIDVPNPDLLLKIGMPADIFVER
jgi:HlyD family secretion protein